MTGYWLADFTPSRVVLEFGFFRLYWYSLILCLAVATSVWLLRRRVVRRSTDERQLIDILFYALIGGFIGARLWHVFVFQWAYYRERLGEIFRIWEGGIAIQGALIGGFIALGLYALVRKRNVWDLTDLIAPVLPLAQAIGRWGNFFNQELYGVPTSAPWGIYIEPAHRVDGVEGFTHFHPVFFYESVLNVLFFVLLWRYSKTKHPRAFVTVGYLLGYGLIRFYVDILRIDPMPMVGIFRSSQVVSLGLITAALALYVYYRYCRRPADPAKV